jgi:PAS domain S-box-containing protein
VAARSGPDKNRQEMQQAPAETQVLDRSRDRQRSLARGRRLPLETGRELEVSVAGAVRSRQEPPREGWRTRFGRSAALWLAILAIWSFYGVAYYHINALMAAGDAARHALDVRYEAERLLSFLGTAETDQEGYIITGDPAYLEPYRAAAAETPRSLQQLSQLTAGNPDQQQRVDRLRSLVADRFRLLEALIQLRQDRGLSAVDTRRLSVGRVIMDRIRGIVAGMEWAENDLFEARSESAEQRVGDSVLLLLVGIVASTLVIVGLFHLKRREVDRRRHTESMLQKLNAELEERVLQRTAEVEQNHRFQSAILERMQDGLFVERNGRVVFANDACLRLFGATASVQLLGKPTVVLFRHDDRQLFQGQAAAPAEAGNPVPAIERQIVRLDGNVLDVEVAAAPFDGNAADATLVILRDMTERKANEKRLIQAQRMEAIGQLTSGMADDFNKLLAVVVGGLGQLEREVKDNGRARALLDVCMRSSLQGAELVHRLLAFSRRQPLDPKIFDLNERVTGTMDMLRRTLGERIDIRMTLAGDLWPAIADPVQVESALVNLAINARDAMPEGGVLGIETANKPLDPQYAAENPEVAPGDYVMLAVSDSGSGIAPEILNRVFEPFFTTKESGKGSGLGLSMVLGFARQSRGHIRIHSEVNRGTVVRLYLPRAYPAPS